MAQNISRTRGYVDKNLYFRHRKTINKQYNEE